MNRLRSLQVCRGIAALAVVLDHACLNTRDFSGGIPPLLERIFLHGALGVDFFFVLSGFIILTSHYADPGDLVSLRRYAIKRAVRIFPSYWIIGLPLLAIYLAWPALRHGRDISVASSIFLVPTHGVTAIPPAWTLVFEMSFYLIFSVRFLSRQLFNALVVAWVIAIAATRSFALASSDVPLLQLWLDPMNIEFVVGMLVAWSARRISSARWWSPILFTGVLLSGVWLALELDGGAWRFAFGLSFGLVVLGLVLFERGHDVQLAPWVLLGDASYVLYLLHNPLISVTSRIAQRLSFHWIAGMTLATVASVLAALAFHGLIERRVQRKLMTVLLPLSGAPRGAEAAPPGGRANLP